jgi:hypothetical protein
MHIKRKDNGMVLSEPIVCVNYGNMWHITSVFEKVSDNEYKCSCGAVLIIKEPVIVFDDKGLQMQVFVETKEV